MRSLVGGDGSTGILDQSLLHAAGEDGIGPLDDVGGLVVEVFAIVPFAGGDGATVVVAEDGRVLGAQEIPHGQALLLVRSEGGDDAVDGGAKASAGEEAEGVAHVDDGVARFGEHAAPDLGARREHLQARLVGEEDRQGPVVRVFVLAEEVGRRRRRRRRLGRSWIAEQVQTAVGRYVGPMAVLEAGITSQSQSVRQARK